MSSALTLTLTRHTGRGNKQSFAAVGLLLLIASATAGQTASPVSSAFRPGRYLPLRLDAAAAGLVRVRGDGVQGVDWPAAGRSSAVVPLMIYVDAGADAAGVAVAVNGRPVRLDVRPLGPHDADPPADPSAAAGFAPVAGLAPSSSGPAFDDDAYQLAALWRPGLDAATRRRTLVAIAVVVLALGVAAHADPKRSTRWIVLASAGLCVSVGSGFPVDAPRRVVPATGQPGVEWVWLAASRDRTASEPWTPGLAFVPQSPAQLKAAAPVLHCDAAGRPVAIDVRVPAGGRAVFVRPRE